MIEALIIVIITLAFLAGVMFGLYLDGDREDSYEARHAQTTLARREQRRQSGDPDWRWDTWILEGFLRAWPA